MGVITNPYRGGGKSPLENPGMIEAVALAYVEGKTREEMCELFEVRNPSTITRWKRDPRVKAKAAELVKDRILRVVRKTDSEIERRLETPGELSTREILEVRQTFIRGPGFEDETAGITPETINEAAKAIENDPEWAAELAKLLERSEATPEPAPAKSD